MTSTDLFKFKIPSLPGMFLPARWLWYCFSRRFNVLPTQWNHAEEECDAVLAMDGLLFGEGPRFRLKNRCVYFSDMYAKRVMKYDLDTQRSSVVLQHDDYVSGLGWLPDNRLLIVAMNERQILAFDEATNVKQVYADVSHVTRFRTNDFNVTATGNAYVGNFGFNLDGMLDFHTTTLVRIAPEDQSVHVEATDVFFPNGSVVTPDGKTLIVAETFNLQLTAFDIMADGSLTNRRMWAYLGVPPDGICLDAEGCIWVAVPQIGIYKVGGALIRVQEGGKILNLFGFGRNNIQRGVFACQLATDKNGQHHLFFLEAFTSHEHEILEKRKQQNGLLKSIRVRVGPARMPANANYSGGYC